MPQAVTIASLPRAFELVKGMQAQGLEWGESYRPLGRQAIAAVRKVGEALLPILGRAISPATVSTVAKQLDAVVAAFHARPLKERYRVLMLDGVVLARKTGAGAIRRPVLVALGLRPDGKKEVIDFRLAHSESAAEWERFLGDLIGRGLLGEALEMICIDGGAGLAAALPTAFPGVPVQRCWAHKIRNVLDKV